MYKVFGFLGKNSLSFVNTMLSYSRCFSLYTPLYLIYTNSLCPFERVSDIHSDFLTQLFIILLSLILILSYLFVCVYVYVCVTKHIDPVSQVSSPYHPLVPLSNSYWIILSTQTVPFITIHDLVKIFRVTRLCYVQINHVFLIK